MIGSAIPQITSRMNHSIPNAIQTAPVTRGPAFVRQGNEWAIYQHLLSLAPASSPQLAASTGLSKVTVSAALGNLERLGLVEQTGVRAGNAGRSPRLYAPRARAGFVVAIDVGAKWIRGAVADLTGTVIARLERPSPARVTQLVARIVEIVDAMLDEQKVPRDDVLVTVLGSPGVLDTASDRLRLAPNLPDWERPGLIPSLREALGADIVIENDINLATLGEQRYGLGRDVEISCSCRLVPVSGSASWPEAGCIEARTGSQARSRCFPGALRRRRRRRWLTTWLRIIRGGKGHRRRCAAMRTRGVECRGSLRSSRCRR